MILSSLASPIRTVPCGGDAAVLGWTKMGGSKLLVLGAAGASASPLAGGDGGFGSALCADAGLALSGTSTALLAAAVASAAVVVGLMSSCSSVL